mgnify:CR=1 FL=1
MSAVMRKNTATSAADAAKIVPRAEFRVFGKEINELVEQKMWDAGAVLQKARKMPAETYFLSAKTDDANVKVRDGLLDINDLVTLFCCKGLRQLANFLSKVQSFSCADKKRSGRTCPTPERHRTRTRTPRQVPGTRDLTGCSQGRWARAGQGRESADSRRIQSTTRVTSARLSAES